MGEYRVYIDFENVFYSHLDHAYPSLQRGKRQPARLRFNLSLTETVESELRQFVLSIPTILHSQFGLAPKSMHAVALWDRLPFFGPINYLREVEAAGMTTSEPVVPDGFRSYSDSLNLSDAALLINIVHDIARTTVNKGAKNDNIVIMSGDNIFSQVADYVVEHSTSEAYFLCNGASCSRLLGALSKRSDSIHVFKLEGNSVYRPYIDRANGIDLARIHLRQNPPSFSTLIQHSTISKVLERSSLSRPLHHVELRKLLRDWSHYWYDAHRITNNIGDEQRIIHFLSNDVVNIQRNGDVVLNDRSETAMDAKKLWRDERRSFDTIYLVPPTSHVASKRFVLRKTS